MAEKISKRGPRHKFPEAVYVLAFELHRQQGMTSKWTAEAINAKELCGRIDAQQIQSLAKIGEKIKADKK